MNKDSKVMFSIEGEDGKKEFYIIADTFFNNTSYILVTDTQEDDGEAYILKEVGKDDMQITSTYEILEDEKELEALGLIFSELLAEEDIELL